MKLTMKNLKNTVKMNRLEKTVCKYIRERGSTVAEREDFMSDLSRGGCSSGMIGGLIYYHQTAQFYDKLEEEIWELAEQVTEDFGYSNVFEFFSSLNGAKDITDIGQFKNLLAWFSFEETARRISEM